MPLNSQVRSKSTAPERYQDNVYRYFARLASVPDPWYRLHLFPQHHGYPTYKRNCSAVRSRFRNESSKVNEPRPPRVSIGTGTQSNEVQKEQINVSINDKHFQKILDQRRIKLDCETTGGLAPLFSIVVRPNGRVETF